MYLIHIYTYLSGKKSLIIFGKILKIPTIVERGTMHKGDILSVFCPVDSLHIMKVNNESTRRKTGKQPLCNLG